MGETTIWQFHVKTKVLMVKPNWKCTKGCMISIMISQNKGLWTKHKIGHCNKIDIAIKD